MRDKQKENQWDICTIVLLSVRSRGFGWIWEVDVVLTIAKMGAHSASYYDSTVDQGIGPDNYYSEAGSAPAQVWIRSNRVAECAVFLGVEQGQSLDGGQVKNWFNHTTAPSGNRLGQVMREDGVRGYDLTFSAPKSAPRG